MSWWKVNRECTVVIFSSVMGSCSFCRKSDKYSYCFVCRFVSVDILGRARLNFRFIILDVSVLPEPVFCRRRLSRDGVVVSVAPRATTYLKSYVFTVKRVQRTSRVSSKNDISPRGIAVKIVNDGCKKRTRIKSRPIRIQGEKRNGAGTEHPERDSSWNALNTFVTIFPDTPRWKRHFT